MALDGFDPDFENFPAYILKITERIWENRDVGSIHQFYAPDCIVHTGMGSVTGVRAVVETTLRTQYQFPDRLILGEDVIWSGSPAQGLLSSHRSMMTQTHRGFGLFGPPTGRSLQFRAIADCAAQGNQIYEEWLIVDQAAAALQAGRDPRDHSRLLAQADEAAGQGAPPLAFSENRSGPDTREQQDDPAARLVRDLQTAIWSGRDLSTVRRGYDRAVNLHLPAGVNAHGAEPCERFLFGYLASFPDAAFAIDHSIARREPGRPVRVATRWTLTGTHCGTGAFGPPSGAPMLILGITHTELVGDRITREWVMVDETAIWRRIARHSG